MSSLGWRDCKEDKSSLLLCRKNYLLVVFRNKITLSIDFEEFVFHFLKKNVFYLKIFQSRIRLLAAPHSDSVLTDRHLQPHSAIGIAAEHFRVFSLSCKNCDAIFLFKK